MDPSQSIDSSYRAAITGSRQSLKSRVFSPRRALPFFLSSFSLCSLLLSGPSVFGALSLISQVDYIMSFVSEKIFLLSTTSIPFA